MSYWKNFNPIAIYGMTHIISPKITHRQRDFILGTILGGSSIVKPVNGKNCYLSMRGKDLDWLRYKATELQNLASDRPITRETTNRWHSMCYPLFNEFRDKFYNGNERIVKIEDLDLFRDIALAVWFGDSGRYEKEVVIFNTHVWGENGTNVIKSYFECLGYSPNIITERDNLRIVLDKESSHEFMKKFVLPHLPHFFSKNL